MAHAFEAATAAPSTGPVATADMLLAGLTAEQTQAVRHGTGPLLIMAGPGTGKTHTLIHRIAWLLAERLAEPWEILAVTFSVRAAGELRLRLSEMLGVELAGGVRAATFHSVCAQLLREHAEMFGRTPEWTVYDQTEVRKTIEWLLSEHQRGQVGASAAATALPAAAEIEREVSLAKNRLLAPGEYQQSAAHPAGALIGEVWRELERRDAPPERARVRRPARARGQTARRAPATCCARCGSGGDGCWSTRCRTPAPPNSNSPSYWPGRAGTSPPSATPTRSSTGSVRLTRAGWDGSRTGSPATRGSRCRATAAAGRRSSPPPCGACNTTPAATRGR